MDTVSNFRVRVRGRRSSGARALSPAIRSLAGARSGAVTPARPNDAIGVRVSAGFVKTSQVCPREESNLRSRFRKPLLYPLSYEGRG
jgi:hypothetical protein